MNKKTKGMKKSGGGAKRSNVSGSSYGKMSSGTAKGMGAATRGGKYKSC